ncbi:LPS export ABC transporter periplasmic protein LptC [Oceanicella sp. SM1341]|uniref:LPS export ABC transporter periplasmic protein LptC n=1 Tax=Oceanicella sp. SM1341 TaxID=1548889 RepID=UPI000E47F8B9|nr:LPS export ABC transporter periplasmic protein LptC [Oceanicella sp. SM1341]
MARRRLGKYSRTVRFLRIGLPLLAIAMMSSVFLIQEDDFVGGIEFSASDIQALGEGLRLTNPNFSGTTDAGEPYMVRAEWAQPDSPDPEKITLHGLSAVIDTRDGRKITLSATDGEMRPDDQRVSLTGEVEMTTSDGYVAKTGHAEADIRRRLVRAPGAVSAEGPMGSIEAGSMEITRPGAEGEEEPASGNEVVLFGNGVRVVYRPEQQKTPSDKE